MFKSLTRRSAPAIVGALLAVSPALAQAPQGARQGAPPALTVNQITPDVYVVTGAGGNSTVIVGKTSVLVVDAKITEAAGRVLVAEIGKITPKPISTVFLTHSDPDHITGLAGFPAGIKVIANATITSGTASTGNVQRVIRQSSFTRSRLAVTTSDCTIALSHRVSARDIATRSIRARVHIRAPRSIDLVRALARSDPRDHYVAIHRGVNTAQRGAT